MKQKLLKSIKLVAQSDLYHAKIINSSLCRVCWGCRGWVGLVMNTELQDLNNGVFNLLRVELGGGGLGIRWRHEDMKECVPFFIL